MAEHIVDRPPGNGNEAGGTECRIGDLPGHDDLGVSRQALLEANGFVTVSKDLVLPEIPWLVDGLWPRNAVGFFAGPPKSGKTWLALEMAACIAAGLQFLERPITDPGEVLYYLGEDNPEDVINLRIDLLLRARGLDRDALGARLHVSQMPVNLESRREHERIVKLVHATKPRLVVFDPLARFLDRADENSATEMRPVTNFARHTLTRELETSVLIVHHSNKAGEGLRGTGDLRAVSEVTLTFGERRRDGKANVRTELRRTRAPEPFDLQVEEKNGGIVLTVHDTRLDPGKVAEAKEVLMKGGTDGKSDRDLKDLLHVGVDKARALARAAGARKTKGGSWVLPEAFGSVALDAKP